MEGMFDKVTIVVHATAQKFGVSKKIMLQITFKYQKILNSTNYHTYHFKF